MDSTKTITHVGLCAGYGGIELGLKRVIPNLRTVALCEIEAFAIANLVAKMEAGLMDPAPIWPDLKTFPWESFRDRVDILTGGYPCQPFSSAGKRAGKDDPRHLWPWIADGIASMRPSICFFENVEGHISLGLSNVIEDLGRMGYRTTWGIFSAAEVGAPHQRKRVFIFANRNDEGLERWNRSILSERTNERTSWPSRPSIPQYSWEPPRVVISMENTIRSGGEEPGAQSADLSPESSGCDIESLGNANSLDRGTSTGGRIDDAEAGSAGEDMGEAVMADTSIIRCDRRSDGSSGRIRQPGEVSVDASGCGGQGNGMRQTEPTVGLHVDECSSVLGQALTLNPNGGNVFWNETIFKKTRAREVLFEVWHQAGTEGFQWETRRLQRFLEEKVLQSGVQLDGFTQRICFFVWCLQTGYQTQGWGLHGMQVYESSRNTSQGQEPMEQLKRELAYAMCQLSYEIALERGQDPVETTGIMQGVRESSERSWALSEALPEMEEVWRSTLDQTVWENGCFIEAVSKGNRTDELRLLGNGVVPATAELAFRTLFSSLAGDL